MTRRWLKLKRWARFQAITLFRVDDGSERVARGFAAGVCVNFFPTFGFGIVISGFLAGFVKGNVIAGFVGGTIFALLWPVLFYFNMQVGELIFHSPIPIDEFEDVDDSTIDILVTGKTFLYGAAVNCIIGSLLAYIVIYFLHMRFRGPILAWLNRLRIRRVQHRIQKQQRKEQHD